MIDKVLQQLVIVYRTTHQLGLSMFLDTINCISKCWYVKAYSRAMLHIPFQYIRTI